MFQPVSNKVSFPALEAEVLRFWREHDVFRKSVEQRPEDKAFVFYEGPPTANASPGIHHVLARIFKDVIPRYRAMRGHRVLRKGGWDTHGLPVELEVEKELGLKSKAEIEGYGVAEFNRRCREGVMRYVRDWEAMTERIAFWLDMERPYITYDNDYIESCWWALRQLWDRGLVFQDYKSVPHCPRCGTSLSDHEVALGYKDDTPDPSIYVKFRLVEPLPGLPGGGVPTYVLAWTTTPWTLPGNTALAVAAEAEYAVVEADGERLIVAEGLRRAAVGDEAPVAARVAGKDLVGLRYEPLYRPEGEGVEASLTERIANLPPAAQQALAMRGVGAMKFGGDGRLIWVAAEQAPPRRIVAADFVSLEEGTGVVHVAPAFGGEDFELGKRERLLFLQPVDLQGRLVAKGTPWDGLFVKEADPLILDDLESRGLLLSRGTIRHTYPFCWRCDTPLLYYAKPTWYIRTTAVKERLLAHNQEVNWYPEHIKDGRFGEWLRNNVDWALSRERYWGTPLPIWRCEGCGERHCIGSVAELRQRAVDPQAADALADLHRPYIDAIALRCEQCGETMRRVPEVIDVWFDSGAMPFAQRHYPFESEATFRRQFPADYICEAVDQTRGWFYTLHALATLLFDSPCYRNVICLGLILDDQGVKMSKRLGNVVEPLPVIEAHGADALRWYLLTASAPGNSRRFSADLVGEVVRRFLLTLWNTYSFFVTYANIDRFDPRKAVGAQHAAPLLDRWVLSELNVLVEKVTSLLEEYNPTDAGRAIEGFLDDLSNWYVRRSRRRFWKSEDDADKLAAHQTLYACLVTLCKLLAPFTPFVAETMYQNLVRTFDAAALESVHLCDWPQADAALVDEGLMADMRLAMRVASLGRAARSQAGIKVRQPLPGLAVRVPTETAAQGLRRLVDEIAAETNVRQVEVTTDPIPENYGTQAAEADLTVALDTVLTPDLADEGLARELVRRLQTMRRNAGFDIADRIVVYYQGDDDIRRVLERFGDYLRQETLAQALVEGEPPEGAHAEHQRVDGRAVLLAVRRV